MSSSRAKVQVINATQLKPGARYLLAFDGSKISMQEASSIAQQLKTYGIENSVVLMTDGDPNKLVKVIVQEPNNAEGTPTKPADA